jgi:hypothetical protein
MRAIFLGVWMVLSAPALASTPPIIPPDGTYTNEEEVYFDREAKRESAPWLGLRYSPGKQEFVDLFGQPVKPFTLRSVDLAEGGRLRVTLMDGRVTELRRARPVTCWGAIPKTAKKPDGSEDWYFVRGLHLHDQGGRVQFGGGDTGAPPVVIRVRNVIWPAGPSQPSVVLYVHKPENPDRAESYSWADPQATRIGINLRWMQASCTIDPMETVK